MSEEVEKIVQQTSIGAAVLGIVLSPIPFADELVLLPVFGVMAARIGKVHGIDAGSLPWRPIGGAIVAGLAARAAVSGTVGFIPGVAAAANAVSAVALTRVLGTYTSGLCQNGGAPEQATT